VTRVQYQHELEDLHRAVLDELDAVARQLSLVLDALGRTDRDVASQVVSRDEDVDRRYAALQNELVALIARQAPVASDLRLITALLHISRMIERMGDQCVNIAKLVPVAGAAPHGAETFHGCVMEMGRHALQAVNDAAIALRDRDLAFADSLAARDDEVDELNRTCFSRAIELDGGETARAWATAMILVARALERIGDNAVDIAAHLRFAATGAFERGHEALAK
jgi:phosphate transport system protein